MDDDAVRAVTAASLRELGYTVLEGGGTALELLERSAKYRAHADRLRHARHERRRSGAPEVAPRVEATRPVVAHPRYGLCGPGGAPLCERSPIGKPFVDTELHEKVRRPWRGGASARSCASDLPEAPEPTRSFHVTSSLRRSK